MDVVFIAFQRFERNAQSLCRALDRGFENSKDLWCQDTFAILGGEDEMRVKQRNAVAFTLVDFLVCHDDCLENICVSCCVETIFS